MSAERPSRSNDIREVSGLGRVRGVVSGDVLAFRGIPYAAAPVGPLRFAPPQPAAPWEGVRDARTPEPIAPQAPSRVYRHMGPVAAVQDEDCLTVTVWRPAGEAENLPVIVWLHGGGFLTGAGALPWFDGSALVREGSVVVGVNYRLGALGFFSDGSDALPGNLAILDQRAALEWVQDHIAQFGGDPRRVTVMGQSGGGHNIASLLSMGEGGRLFGKAILQSPPLGIGLMSGETAAARAGAFLGPLGLDAADPHLVDRLRSTPLADILQAQGQAAMALSRMHKGDLRPPFTPTELSPHRLVSETFVETAATQAATTGVDVMIGWTREEANLFLADHPAFQDLSLSGAEALATEMFGPRGADLLAAAATRRPDGAPAQLVLDIVTDLVFRLPSEAMAARIVEAGGRAFVYQFDWPSPSPGLGACHCLDLPFTFNSWPAWRDAPLVTGGDLDAAKGLSGEMVRRWAGFAASGDPGFAAWSGDGRPLLHLDTPTWLGAA